LTTVNVSAITFSYPSGWSKTGWDAAGSFTYMVAAVSNGALKTPCTHSPMTVTCGPPIDQMDASTLLVEWWQNGFPGWDLAHQEGSPVQVDGLNGKIQDPADPKTVCTNIGADSALRVQIDRGSSNYFEFDACFKGPGTATQKTEALTILNSGRFKR